ncbi:DUF2267 domain-containing protein [Pedomonas mirosovicensis]|uniref:DUF2267 domain-containing protein n=1 Tax=Pedomonas mirosovicensis TaxID=2908641 RepID=UPI002168C5B5|nr:DUF2267 domain-containing protein [Pedomonas mirosovicensis]MCH8686045.1 DUF2267 domain-containing protein [Pedomonas mirosovicensis]
MSTTGLDVFDKTLQTTHIWLNDIGEIVGPDKQRCYHALRAVLTTLRDRLTVDQSAHLAAELPILVRGVFYDGYRPSDAPSAIRSQDEFVSVVAQRFGNIGPVSPRTSSIAVFKTLQRHLPQPMIEKVKGSLPQEIRVLFDVEPDTGPGAHQDTAASRSAAGERRPQDWTGAGRGATPGGSTDRNT